MVSRRMLKPTADSYPIPKALAESMNEFLLPNPRLLNYLMRRKSLIEAESPLQGLGLVLFL